MNTQLQFAVKKDFSEYRRNHVNVILGISLLLIAGGVLGITLYMPNLITILGDKAPEMFSNIGSLSELMAAMFPADLSKSLGVLSANIAGFYSIIVILIVQEIIPKEVKTGRWIIPISAGYSRDILLLAKVIVYSIGASLPAMMIYNAYYLIASSYLNADYKMSSAFACSVILGFFIWVITVVTILSSIIFKNYVVCSVSLIMCILLTPDILEMFSFGKYLPTYLLSYITKSMETPIAITVPAIECIAVIAIMYILAAKKVKMIEVNR